MGIFRKAKPLDHRVVFAIEELPSDLADTVGELAVPVGHSLKVWNEQTGALVEFELVRLDAQPGEPALARFHIKRGHRQ